jgi:DMSO/TMAO reductase YedYZ molybdopterin-dependent catalytic subunit
MNISRRELFALTAGTGFYSRRGFADVKTQDLIVNSARPKDYEMALGGFAHWITPVEQFFIRSHHYTPEVKLPDWSLKVEGLVNNPLTLSMDDLKKMPRVTLTGVLECAGNGRALYAPHVPGMQWRFGGVGNGKWTGVRLRDVLQKAGVKDSSTEVLFDGADVPIGTMPKFQRTITAKKALDPDTLLAYEMNDQPIPMDHGFPLRLIASGWAGDSWVKWIRRIEVLDHEFDGFWMKVGYRHPPKPVAPGTPVPPEQMVPVTDLAVKSQIGSPAEGWRAPGNARITGAAWSNGAAITGVDVSVDGGKTWHAAKLGRNQSKYAWRLFEFPWKATEGSYTILSRAKDAAGRVQPMEQEWNPSGYLWNVAQARQISVSKDERPPPSAQIAGAEQPHGYKTACLTCHDNDIVQMQRLNSAQWDREINKMTGWGAQIKPEDRDGIVNYLKSNFKQ